jgi:hypothetical protein
MAKTLRKNKSNKKTIKRKLSGGSSSVWKDLLKMSVIPSMSKIGGNRKKTISKKIYKSLGFKKANKIMKGGFIRSGSTQFFPVNCTKVNNVQNVETVKNKSGGKRKNKRTLKK